MGSTRKTRKECCLSLKPCIPAPISNGSGLIIGDYTGSPPHVISGKNPSTCRFAGTRPNLGHITRVHGRTGHGHLTPPPPGSISRSPRRAACTCALSVILDAPFPVFIWIDLRALYLAAPGAPEARIPSSGGLVAASAIPDTPRGVAPQLSDDAASNRSLRAPRSCHFRYGRSLFAVGASDRR